MEILVFFPAAVGMLLSRKTSSNINSRRKERKREREREREVDNLKTGTASF
jgi:hypothetical protein